MNKKITGQRADLVCIDDLCTGCDYPKPVELVCTKPCPPAGPFTQQYDEPQSPDPRFHDTVNFDWVRATGYDGWKPVLKQKGNNPMATTTMTGIAITAPKSDDMQMREYLISEFTAEFGWHDRTERKLRKTFNMDAPTRPETAQGLIDAIKAGKYSIDQKAMDKAKARYDEYLAEGDIPADQTFEGFLSDQYSWSYGLTFTDMPKPDKAGYAAATKAWEAAKRDAKTKLRILPPAEGLDLLLSLRNWTPTGKAN